MEYMNNNVMDNDASSRVDGGAEPTMPADVEGLVNSKESRSLYIGHLPYEATYYDLCKIAHKYGPLELVRLMQNKRCAFLNFVRKDDAKKMISDFDSTNENGKKLTICGKTVKLSWSGGRPINPEVLQEIQENGASRNLFVFLGKCNGLVSADEIANKFKAFGYIEDIVIKPKKKIAFVNMTSLSSAIEIVKCSQQIECFLKSGNRKELGSEFSSLYIRNGYLVVKYSTEEKSNENYAYEKPQYQPHAWHQPVIARNPYYNMSLIGGMLLEKEEPLPHGWMSSFDDKTGCKYYYNSQQNVTQWEHPVTGKASPPIRSPPLNFVSTTSRALILQNLPKSVNYAKLCTLGRQHGIIESVRILDNKETAFINYVDSQGAWSLFSLSQRVPIVIDSCTLKINWAKETQLSPELYRAVINEGANRSVYLRDLDPSFSEEDVKEEFERFTGSFVESIVLRPQDKAFGFINFIDVKSAKLIVDSGKKNDGCFTFPDGRTIHVSYVNLKQKPRQSQPVYPASNVLSFRASQQCRSVIISGFPQETTNADIASLGKAYGHIESLHLIHAKNHAFINFILPDSATKFMTNSSDGSGYHIRDTAVRVGFGKSVPIKPDILLAMDTEGACRTVYVSGVLGNDNEIEENLRDLVVQHCKDDEIENIIVNADKNFAFITLTSIHAAKKIVSGYKDLDLGEGRALNFSYARPQALNSV